MPASSRSSAIALLAVLSVATAACERRPPATYVPGLGEIMAATQFGFNVVARPTGNPYTNQNFDVPR